MAEEPDLSGVPQAAVTRKKRLRISIVWIIPLLAALVAIGIAIQRLSSEGPTITIVMNGRKASRPARPSSATRTCGSGSSPRSNSPKTTRRCWSRRRSRSMPRGSWLRTPSSGSSSRESRFPGCIGTEHAAFRQLHRFPGRQIERNADALLCARRSARHHGRAGAAVRAEDTHARFPRCRHADLLPAPQRRPGDHLRARSRRPVRRRHDLHPCALRQVRHDRDAFLER